MGNLRLNYLIKKLKQGKSQYFDEFYALTKGAVYYAVKTHVTGSDVEDVMQETYVKFLSVISGVDEKKNPLAFLYEIAKNKALDVTRKRSRTDTDVIVEEMQIGVNEVYSHDSPLMELCKKRLTENEYFLLEKVFILGYKQKEVAAMLGEPISTVNHRYKTLVKKVKLLYKEAYA